MDHHRPGTPLPAYGVRSQTTDYCELAVCRRDTFNFRSKTYLPYGAGLYLRRSAPPIGRRWREYLDQSRTSYECSLSLASVQWTRTTLISVFSSRRSAMTSDKGNGFFNVDAVKLTRGGSGTRTHDSQLMRLICYHCNIPRYERKFSLERRITYNPCAQ